MPILTGDIKLVASQVMHDVPEGGGAPTATVIIDGTSNAIFPDISELDRAGGRVNLRKLHVTVQTDDTDTYLGSNVIVSEPPADPNVSITLFSTKETFDRRTDAKSRIESYLTKGPMWAGYLLENHIAGQRVIQIFQRLDDELPTIGQTLVLCYHEGEADETTQYVRTTAVSSATRKFYDASTDKDFIAAVVSCSISDALRYDFSGTSPSKYFFTGAGKTLIRDTVVADAGTYVGVAPLAVAADVGDFTVYANSIYTQLVPSSQIETPISDVRTNGLSNALVATGAPVVQTISIGFTTTQNMFVGGPIYPGSLSIVRSGVTLLDTGGLLTNAGAEVGQVDYDNGIITLSTNVWGTGGGSHTVTFVPAAVPDLISDSMAIQVTAESRSLSYVLTMGTAPLPRTLSVSYLAQGRWYVLRDNGAGVLKGASSSFGIGTLSYTTGSLSVTLGALPDVGSAIVIQSYSGVQTAVSNTVANFGGRVWVPINSDGQVSAVKGTKPFEIGKLTISWMEGAVAKYAYDNALGAFTGDATGIIDYAQGVVYLSPNTLPAAGTLFSLGTVPGGFSALGLSDRRVYNAAPPTIPVPGTPGYVIPAHTVSRMVQSASSTLVNAAPGTISIKSAGYFYYACNQTVGGVNYESAFNNRPVHIVITDNGQGVLSCTLEGVTTVVGSADYNTNSYVMGSTFDMAPGDSHGPVYMSTAGSTLTWDQMPAAGKSRHLMIGLAASQWPIRIPDNYVITPAAYQDVTIAELTVPAVNPSSYTAPKQPDIPTATIASVAISTYFLNTTMVPNYTLKGVSFALGATRYQQLTDGTLNKNMDPMTGGGTPAGSVSGALGTVFVTSWTTGAPSLVTDWRGLIAPPSVGVAAPFSAFSTTFRTAASPLRTGGVSVLGTMQDGTAFNVTADANGKINGTRVKGRVNYQHGLIELVFVNPNGDVAISRDLSYLGIAGVGTMPVDLAMLNSLRYNAVSFSYLPLDADLLGIDPVRLPSDGRVPIFRAGGFAVIGHAGSIVATVANAQVINCARVRLSRVRVTGHNGVVINAGYAADLEAGTVTFTDVAGYSQPVTVEHRIEDMAVVRDVQISGEISFTRPVTHSYPLGSYISSALMSGDQKARVSHLFDQETWTASNWLDIVSGTAATGTYNDVIAPVVVTNKGSISEKWALQFTNTTNYNIVGEHVGVIGTGTINADCAPINPATNVPYFTLRAAGWGLGWSVGNVLRLNTVGAMFPVWVVRTIQQGPNTGTEHSFTLLSRGDVDRA